MIVMTVAEMIAAKLRDAFNPEELTVIDESAQHAGHGGARPEGETHFAIEITSTAFVGKSRIDASRMVHDVLADELKGPVHALSLRARAPLE